MPKGIPVATVAIDGARNAGLLAVRMLAIADETLRDQLEEFSGGIAAEVREKDARLQSLLESERRGG
jgi:5-(carboxyamino)imidazole ribonucleotide mutase